MFGFCPQKINPKSIFIFRINYQPQPDVLKTQLEYLNGQYTDLNKCIDDAKELYNSGKYNKTIAVVAEEYFSNVLYNMHHNQRNGYDRSYLVAFKQNDWKAEKEWYQINNEESN